MSAYDDLVRNRTTPAQVLDAMAMGAKPDSDDRNLFTLLARLFRRQRDELEDASREINEAWSALGELNRPHLELSEAITSRLRELEQIEEESI
jgi:hypothetical protein